MIVIAGPCVIESKEQVMRIAESLHYLKEHEFYFKASFDKANRTSLDSFRGVGMEEGLKILQEVNNEFGYKILTDIHETSQVKPVSEVVDVLQIPAFLCRQTDLLVEAAKTDKIVNIKKGQFMSPNDMKFSVLKVLKTRGCNEVNYDNSLKHKVWLTERGSSFGYNNLVVDMRSLIIMRQFAPVIFDATHSVQMPGGANGKSSGKREYVPYLARAAAAVGVDGFFFEVHYNPQEALSDGDNMLELEQLQTLIPQLEKISTIQ
ncbi:MAG: 3-deoxy-8-phosphooctulonate synthase [Epsilonproteobacteria bacterium]|nr:3-deoxy-8-phosphooctulonate synthase [Campylobacterota bacterium]